MKAFARGLIFLVLGGAIAHAQGMRGTVRDSATQSPLAGVVVNVLDGNGGTLARVVTNQQGGYSVANVPNATRVGVLRIGFRPRTVDVGSDGATNVTMIPIPPLLEPVTVRAAANCPKRPDREQALSLLQQARAGLLATITSRETNKAALTRVRFVRSYDESGKHILDQRVAVDSSSGLSQSFGAVRSGEDFVAKGFVDKPAAKLSNEISMRQRNGGSFELGFTGGNVFYGPDAETLLDDDFAAGYCFQIADKQPDRPKELGLAFHAASRKKGRVDIDGTLWIDTTANELRDIRFDYVGDDRPVRAMQPGGNIEFRTMGNGMVIIDRWSLKVIGAGVDTTRESNKVTALRPFYGYQEQGGEVATASWDDGFTWHASLGSFRALAVDYRNAIARGAILRLKNTDYIASPNARGILEIPNLLPGPYVATVIDSTTARLGITLPTPITFDAERDSTTQRSFALPRVEEFVLDACLDGTPPVDAAAMPLLIRVTDLFGKAVPGATVSIVYNAGAPFENATEQLTTDSAGETASCLRYPPGHALDVTVADRDAQFYTSRFDTGDKTFANSKVITIRVDAKRR